MQLLHQHVTSRIELKIQIEQQDKSCAADVALHKKNLLL